MKYFEVTFTAQPCNETITDVLSGLTADIGFESFVECENGMKAYIQQSQFDEAARTRLQHQEFAVARSWNRRTRSYRKPSGKSYLRTELCRKIRCSDCQR